MPPRHRPGSMRATRAAADAMGQGEPTVLQEAIVHATAAATPSLRHLCGEARISTSTLSSWRRGLRTPPPEAVAVLADVLLEHARVLEAHARALHELAEGVSRPSAS